jgi:hypothetical protein
MAKKSYDFPPLEALDVSDMWEGVEGLGEIITKQQAMDMGIATVAGAGGALLAAAVIPMIPWINETATKKSLSAVAVGLVGGRLLWNVNREVALGLAGGVAGLGFANLIGGLTGIKTNLSGLGEDEGSDYDDLSDPVVGTPLSDATVETSFSAIEDEELLGLSDGMRGFEDAVVENDSVLGAFLQ